MGRSEGRPDPRPSYAQALNYTGVTWRKVNTHRSPFWQCVLSGKPTLGKGEGQGKLHLASFRANRAEYAKAAKAWDRGRIALACILEEVPVQTLKLSA